MNPPNASVVAIPNALWLLFYIKPFMVRNCVVEEAPNYVGLASSEIQFDSTYNCTCQFEFSRYVCVCVQRISNMEINWQRACCKFACELTNIIWVNSVL